MWEPVDTVETVCRSISKFPTRRDVDAKDDVHANRGREAFSGRDDDKTQVAEKEMPISDWSKSNDNVTMNELDEKACSTAIWSSFAKQLSSGYVGLAMG